MSRPDPTLASAPAHERDSREYGRAGLFGLLIPPANPTVEPEMRVLLPDGCATLTSRLTSRGATLRERLADYGTRLPEFVASFGDIAFDAIGFACTGTSYLVDVDEDVHRRSAPGAHRRIPIITAAAAVEAALATLGVRSIALISPYPPWLTQACRAHWQQRDLQVCATLQLPTPAAGGHGIYAWTTRQLLEAVAGFDAAGADAMLLAGTGMPTLRAILALQRAGGPPVLSSNLCLAWALAGATGRAERGPESRLLGGWSGRLTPT